MTLEFIIQLKNIFMKKTNRPKIAIIARTAGLEYDDRIRKECITLSKKADLKIFVNFTDNRKEEGVTSYGISYESFRLRTRDKLPSSKFLFIKSIEFYLQVTKQLKEYDYVWSHEIYTYIFPLFGSGKRKYIWDQHEIPARFLKPILKPLFRFIESKCIYMIHANEYRKDYLIQQNLINSPEKHKVIRNYPDDKFSGVSDTLDKKAYKLFLEWLQEDEYVYLQGLSTNRRYPLNTVEAILQETNLKIVIIGGMDETAKKCLTEEYGNQLNDRVYFRGMVDQLDIPMYIKGARFSIVLYDIFTPNNKFCEPNRMYQAIVLGVPVIVGCNEPMKDIVEKHQFGIALDHDGKNLNDLKKQIKKLDNKIDHFKKNIELNKSNIMWSNQELELLQLIK